MPSFDVVSKADLQEVANAVDQTRREIETRYDFKGSKAEVTLNDNVITIIADDQMRLQSVQDILRQKLAKRDVNLRSVTFEDARPAGGDTLRQEVKIKQGLETEELKRLNKLIKAQKFKVTSQIQGDQLRVSGKKRDELQEVINHFKLEVSDLDLQFINFRD